MGFWKKSTQIKILSSHTCAGTKKMAAREDEHCGFPDSIHVRTMARRRGSPPGSPRLGSSAGRLETSADLKRRSTKAFQLESSNSARNFGKTLRFARFFILGSLVTALIKWENHFRPRHGVLTDSPEPQGAIDELLKPRMGRPDPAETQAMLRRVERAYLDVPRSALNPTKYTPPNPALTIPRNLDILLADIDKPHSPSDVPFFWHILKSGGTTTKDAAGMCLKKVEASESGILEGHQLDQVIQKVHLSGGAIEYVNGKRIVLLLIAFQLLVIASINIVIYSSVQLIQPHHKAFKEPFPWVLLRVVYQMSYFLPFSMKLLNFSTIQVIKVEPFAFSGTQLSEQSAFSTT
jgi:hypothetical protein